MDVGKMLRNRKLSFRKYRDNPEKPPKKWGVFPSMIIDQLIFKEEDIFYCPVELFSPDAGEIVRMRDSTIASANKGFKIMNWDFFLHAANNEILKSPKIYTAKINLAFKVRFQNITEEEV